MWNTLRNIKHEVLEKTTSMSRDMMHVTIPSWMQANLHLDVQRTTRKKNMFPRVLEMLFERLSCRCEMFTVHRREVVLAKDTTHLTFLLNLFAQQSPMHCHPTRQANPASPARPIWAGFEEPPDVEVQLNIV